MTIEVKIDRRNTDRSQKWIVKKGTGRGAGGRVVSRHRLKRAAERSARNHASTGEKILVEHEQTGIMKSLRGRL